MSALDRLGIKHLDAASSREYSERQRQTRDAFGFKWAKRETYESDSMKENTRRWLLERYCDNDPSRLDKWFSGGRKIILDAGCGSGFSAMLFFSEHLRNHDYLGVDVSDAVEVAKARFREAGYPGDFLKMSLFDLPIRDETVDVIFSEGVLHHTDSTEHSIKYLARKVKKNGLFMFYVYAKKAVIREFTDDYIREQLKGMTDEEAWEALNPLTQLGMELGKMNIDIDIPADIPFLGIKKGRIDLQRFFYWNICKLYYRPEYSLDEMNHINFDWFRPLNCHRHTPEEVERWCAESGLNIVHMNVQEAGITVVAFKL
ncbi:MAG: class I SAM-dependent methyltransferase [Nitrospirota bacterium]